MRVSVAALVTIVATVPANAFCWRAWIEMETQTTGYRITVFADLCGQS